MGVNTVAHVESMPDALRVKLSKEDIDRIHEASPYDPGFPMSFFYPSTSSQKYDLSLTPKNHQHIQMAAWVDTPPKPLVSVEFVTLQAQLTIGSPMFQGLNKEVDRDYLRFRNSGEMRSSLSMVICVRSSTQGQPETLTEADQVSPIED